MAVSILTDKVIGNGNGSARTFSFSDVVISKASDLVVTKRDANGVETPLSEGTTSTTYSVSVASYPGTGSIDYPASGGTLLASGESISMKPVRELTQAQDLNNQGGYFADTQETMFDKLTYICQQQQEEIDRSLKIPVTDVTTTLATLQANLISLAAIEADITTVAGISANVTTVAGISADVTTVAGISTDVTTAAEVAGLSFKYLFDDSTSMADPGSGDIRYDNATPASVTNLAISNTYSGGADISTLIAAWDDIANSGTRATIQIRKANTAGTFQVFNVTGAITDNGAWLNIPVTHVAGATLPTDGDSLYVSAALVGADGTGDLIAANNLSDVDNATTAFDNIKQAASTTSTGAVEKSTSAENVAGTSDTVYPSVAGVKEMIIEHGGNAEAAYLMSIESLFRETENHGLLAGISGPGVFDGFDTDSLATKTNATYDATNDKYHNPGVASSTKTTITAGMLTITGFGSPSASEMVNGTTAADEGGFPTASTAAGGAHVVIDFGSAVEFVKWSQYIRSAVSTGLWKIQYSSDNIVWNDTDSGTTEFSSFGQWYHITWTSVGAYRYWKMVNTASTAGQGWHSELELFEQDDPANMTLIPSNTTVTVDPTDLRFDLIIKEVDALTLGTDLTVRGTRDGGTTYSDCTLTKIGTLPGGDSHIKATVDVSGQPTGTAMKYELKSLNNKEIELKFTNQLPIYA